MARKGKAGRAGRTTGRSRKRSRMRTRRGVKMARSCERGRSRGLRGSRLIGRKSGGSLKPGAERVRSAAVETNPKPKSATRQVANTSRLNLVLGQRSCRHSARPHR